MVPKVAGVIAAVLALVVLVFFCSYLLTGRLCSADSRLYLLDYPNNRSLHTTPVPRTGGIAILLSFSSGLLLLMVFAPELGSLSLAATPDDILGPRFGILWILGMSLLLGAVSFWDDRVGLPPFMRMGWHTLAAAGIVFGAGLSINSIKVPLLGGLSLEWLAVPFTMLFIIWMTNLYNFMDGIDGLAGGMTVLGFGFLAVLTWVEGYLVLCLLSSLIAAATAGFLAFNFPPARIFMGDVGSVPIGFLAGVASVMGVQNGLFDLWVPVLIFSPFIVDATLTLLRRLSEGQKVWLAHRDHFYQRAVLAGLGHRRTVLYEYVLMAVCGVGSLLYCLVSERWQFVLLLTFVLLYGVLTFGVSGLCKASLQRTKQGLRTT